MIVGFVTSVINLILWRTDKSRFLNGTELHSLLYT